LRVHWCRFRIVVKPIGYNVSSYSIIRMRTKLGCVFRRIELNQGRQRLQRCGDSYSDFTQSIYSTGDDIAWDYGSDSCGGSRHDQVTGPKGNRSRNKSDNIRDWPYQFSDIRFLLDRSIDRKPNTA
jgi:hypothetical protein